MLINTKLDDLKLRFATIDDVSLILEFIRGLAEYEKMLDKVVATEEVLIESLFKQKSAEVIIGEHKNQPLQTIDAVPMDEWTIYRLHDEALDKLSKKF